MATAALAAFGAAAERLPLVWPTPNRAFLEGKPEADYVQPTSSGRLESGLYGCTRNGGRRFHEGIDLKATTRDRNRRATDPVFAAMPGRVVHVHRTAGNSSYGIYVVLAHDYDGVAFYSLYAHLASVDEDARLGRRLEQGDVLGVMGNTAGGYVIPRSRAHLHFELGLRLADDFRPWFDRQGFGSRNRHGDWNGMNLVGWNPLEFYRLSLEGKIDGPRDYLLGSPAAVRVRVADQGIPGLARRAPGLVEGDPAAPRAGWDVEFSAYGVPLRFRPVSPAAMGDAPPPAEIRAHDPDLAFPPCRDLLDGSDGAYRPGSDLRRALELIFGSERIGR